MNFPRAFRRAALTGAALCATALIAACGGGDQVDQFQPSRIVSFGDETNVIVENNADTSQDGRNYGVNDLTTGTPNCNTYPTWNQRLAIRYGLAFNECGGTTAAPQPSRIFASATASGRRVAGVAAQIDSAGSLGSSDLVTVHTGWADIIEANSTAEAAAAGQALAAQINRVAATGARVLFLTVHRVGETPFGRASGRAAQLNENTAAFNNGLRNAVVNDGRKIVMVDADLRLHQIVRFVADREDAGFSDNISDASTPLCPPPTPTPTSPTDPSLQCRSDALVAGADTFRWLFADNLRWSPGANLRIGDLAFDRARNHPL